MLAMLKRAWVLAKHTYFSYMRDQCTQLAAAISYYVLFSIIPLAIFTVSVFGFALNNADLRSELVDRILEVVPLSPTEGRSAVEHALDNAKAVSGPIAALALLGTMWTASTVFGSIRKSLNVVWGLQEHRPFIRQKLIDFTQVGLLSVILLSSFALTGVLRAARQISADWLGPFGNSNPLWEIPSILLPAVLSFTTFVMLYRIVPSVRPRLRDILPGALLATVLFEALKNSFAFYVAYFNDFDVIYASLGGALLFLLYTFMGSNILLIGAEVAHTLERYHRGEFAEELAPAPADARAGSAAARAFRALFLRQ